MPRSRSGVQRAVLEQKQAPLSRTEFAVPFLLSHFDEVVVRALYDYGPKWQRGPMAGEPRARIHWIKVLEGGWSRHNGGRVYRPGRAVHVRVIDGRDPDRDYVILDADSSVRGEAAVAMLAEKRWEKRR